jgi:multidrug efflux pump subunit AcrA (membrane-fusion protein)
VRAPSNGIVVQVAKEEGEFIGPNDPRLLTIVQLDRLLATFAVPSSSARQVRHGQVVTVGLPESNTQVQGTVKLIAPVVEGKSGTMRIEVCVDNSRRQYLSGEPCTLVLDGQRQPTSGSSRNSQ